MSRHVPIAEFANVICPRSCPYKVIVLLTAYFDESGTHTRSPLVNMSGFVGTSETWKNVEAQWMRVLSEHSVPVFHAVDCENGTNDFRDHIHWNRARRELIFSELSSVLCASNLVGISSAVIRPDWDDVLKNFAPPEFVRRFPNPYNICFENCVQTSVLWSRRFAEASRIAFVFADHSEYRPWAHDVVNAYQLTEYRDLMFSVSFSSPKDVVPLQAADLLAYEIFRNLLPQGESIPPPPGTQRVLRPALERLRSKNQLYGGYFGKEELLKIISNHASGPFLDWDPIKP